MTSELFCFIIFNVIISYSALSMIDLLLINFDRVWDDLDDNQRQAAGVLGYTKETWDSEGEFSNCCVVL